MGAQHFSKAFFFPNNKRKTKTLFLFDYWASPRKSTRPWPFSVCSTERGDAKAARLEASVHGRLAQRNRGGVENGHGHDTPVLSASRQRGGRQRPMAISSHDQARWSTHRVHEEMANLGLWGKGREEERGCQRRSASSTAPPMEVRAEMLN
jgi:hypothetical protein